MNNGVTSCRLHYVVAWIPTTVGVSNVHGLTVTPAEGPTKKDPKKQQKKTNYSLKPQWGMMLHAALN